MLCALLCHLYSIGRKYIADALFLVMYSPLPHLSRTVLGKVDRPSPFWAYPLAFHFIWMRLFCGIGLRFGSVTDVVGIAAHSAHFMWHLSLFFFPFSPSAIRTSSQPAQARLYFHRHLRHFMPFIRAVSGGRKSPSDDGRQRIFES